MMLSDSIAWRASAHNKGLPIYQDMMEWAKEAALLEAQLQQLRRGENQLEGSRCQSSMQAPAEHQTPVNPPTLITPTPVPIEPDPLPLPTTTRTMTAKDHDDKGFHPGERWKEANRRLRAIAGASRITDDQVRVCIAHLHKIDSSKRLIAQQLHELADWLEKEPHPKDIEYKKHVEVQMFDVCSDAPTQEEVKDLLDLARTPWQVVFHQRALFMCLGGA